MAGSRRFRLDYAETLKRWRNRYDLAVARGDLDGFGEAVPQFVALLSDVLRGRLPWRRDRRRAGHDGQRLTAAVAITRKRLRGPR